MTSDSISTRPRISEPRMSPDAPGLRAMASAAALAAPLAERAEPGRERERESGGDDRPLGDLAPGRHRRFLRVKRAR